MQASVQQILLARPVTGHQGLQQHIIFKLFVEKLQSMDSKSLPCFMEFLRIPFLKTTGFTLQRKPVAKEYLELVRKLPAETQLRVGIAHPQSTSPAVMPSGNEMPDM